MKVNVTTKKALSYPVNPVEITGREGDVYTFYLRKMDAFDEAQQGKLFRQICDNYLGVPTEVAGKSRKITKRADPALAPPKVEREDGSVLVVKPDEDLFFVVAGICVMQDWANRENDCYDPEEIMRLAAVDKDVWDELQSRAEKINLNPLGKDLPADTGEKSEPPLAP